MAVVESVFEFQGREFGRRRRRGRHRRRRGRRLLQKRTGFLQPGDGDFGGQVVGQADEQHVEAFVQDAGIMPIATRAVGQGCDFEHLVAATTRMLSRLSMVPPALADDAAARDADPQRLSHGPASVRLEIASSARPAGRFRRIGDVRQPPASLER